MSLHTLLLIGAIVGCGLEALGIGARIPLIGKPVSLGWAGLACLAASFLVS